MFSCHLTHWSFNSWLWEESSAWQMQIVRQVPQKGCHFSALTVNKRSWCLLGFSAFSFFLVQFKPLTKFVQLSTWPHFCLVVFVCLFVCQKSPKFHTTLQSNRTHWAPQELHCSQPYFLVSPRVLHCLPTTRVLSLDALGAETFTTSQPVSFSSDAIWPTKNMRSSLLLE